MPVQTFEEFAESVRPHFNELCMVSDTHLCRLIGVGRDDEDRYYIVQDFHARGRDTKIVWSSAVGGFLPLKGRMLEEDYVRSESTLFCNGCGPAEKFIIEDQSLWDRSISTIHNLVSKCGRFIITLDEQNPDKRFTLLRAYPEIPGHPEAEICKGELSKLEGIAKDICAELDDWTKGQAA